MPHASAFPEDSLTTVERARYDVLTPPGSLVRLRSGGPIGVVSALSQDDDVTVTWFTAAFPQSIIPQVCVVASARTPPLSGGAS